MTPLLNANLEQAPAVARAWGLDGIEVTLGADDAVKQFADAAFRRTFRQTLTKAGCEAPSFCPGLLNQGNLGNSEPDLVKRAGHVLDTVIDAAPDVGARVVLVPFFGKADLKGDAKVDLLVERIKPFADRARTKKLVLALETTLPARSLLSVLERIGSPAVKVYYDLANAVWQKYDPAAEIRELGPAIAQVHLKDNVADPKGWGGFRIVPLGSGRVDFASCAMALRAVRYDGWYVLETAVVDNDHRRSAETQLRFARDHFE
jgi:sugar phosphate isomerase/epimerase